MIFSYPPQNAYLYCLPEHPLKRDADKFKFLSIKKAGKFPRYEIGDIVFLLYRKNKQAKPGIIGYCTITGELTKASNIPIEKRDLCFDKCLLQLPVDNIRCGITKNIMDEDLLYSLPCMNEIYGRYRVFSEFRIINTYFLLNSAIAEYNKFWYIWWSNRSDKEVQQYKELYVHEQREKLDYETYLGLSNGITKCEKCNIEHSEFIPYTPRFFEFHEVNVKPIGKYQKINHKNFVPLCTNCHKVEHEKMVSDSYIYKFRRYDGFSLTHLFSNWKSKYFIDNYDL